MPDATSVVCVAIDEILLHLVQLTMLVVLADRVYLPQWTTTTRVQSMLLLVFLCVLLPTIIVAVARSSCEPGWSRVVSLLELKSILLAGVMAPVYIGQQDSFSAIKFARCLASGDTATMSSFTAWVKGCPRHGVL